MSKFHKSARNVSNPTCNWQPSREEAARLREIGRQDPSISNLLSEILRYSMLSDGGSEFVDDDAWAGVHHILDGALMRLAATPAKTELELALKQDFLAGVLPRVATHGHLQKMALAALEEDIARLRPTDPFFSLDRRS